MRLPSYMMLAVFALAMFVLAVATAPVAPARAHAAGAALPTHTKAAP